MGDSPRKRPRLDRDVGTVKSEDVGDDSEVKILDFQSHPTLYFEDGNTILSCGSMLFCVHRSLIAKHSPVFKALLESSAKRTLRGLRHIEMQESAEDIEAVLNVIYEGLQVEIPSITVESSPLLSSILRMCTKYKIQRPCDEILNRIKREWPHKLADHDAKMLKMRVQPAPVPQYIVQNGQNVPNPAYNPNAGPVIDEEFIIHPGTVISLLRECGYDDYELLTPLFYALTRGTWQFGGAAVGHNIAPLLHADIERLIIGIERLRSHYADAVVQMPSIPAWSHRAQCVSGIRAYWATLPPALLKANNGSRQPVEEWYSVSQQLKTNPNVMATYAVCNDCARLLIAEMDRRRELMWACLPKYFELQK